jgi:DeoR family transcriptional regulator of aga operon
VLAVDRQQRIVEYLEREGSYSNTRLAKALGVSVMTVRRDLADLERRGVLRRVHGGAQALDRDIGYSRRSRRRHAAKAAIGAAAAALVRDAETVYLDAGSTTMEVALALLAREVRGVRVVTHAVNIAAELSGRPHLTVVQIGGELYRQTHSATGPMAVRAIEALAFDRLFLAAQGFDPEVGLTNTNLAEVDVKAAAIRAARRVHLVADAGKWRQASFARFAPLAAAHTVITDDDLPPEGADALRAAGLEVILARTRPPSRRPDAPDAPG